MVNKVHLNSFTTRELPQDVFTDHRDVDHSVIVDDRFRRRTIVYHPLYSYKDLLPRSSRCRQRSKTYRTFRRGVKAKVTLLQNSDKTVLVNNKPSTRPHFLFSHPTSVFLGTKSRFKTVKDPFHWIGFSGSLICGRQ